ncbi:Nuclease SbcCD subunit D [BD1-7 clade bacterium]|uniref:Nuclease SbcCD subunit D n=1 Tax=BD1-7 clade bacterium TaxID=2029982 RepID=A0A5S9PUM6_9GAMM|nr:Nuclease SbcCD subunit D [BD1-7 clade bacterium]
MKFLHTSDWHIGRQFHNVSLLDDQATMLDRIIAQLSEHDVDALVIAGDLYDRSVPPASAVALLDKVFHTISVEMNIPILLIPGNHDSAERLRFAARQLRTAGIYIFGDLQDATNPVILKGKSGTEVAFFGLPYNDPEQVRLTFNAADIKTHNDAHTFMVDRIRTSPVFKEGSASNTVLISHCFVDGASACESERPLAIGGAERVDYQCMENFGYVALGHLHSPQYKGAEHIRYSGSPMKYSFSEVNQKKGTTLVTFDNNGLVEHKHLPLIADRDMRIIDGEIQTIIDDAADDSATDDYLLIRLQDKHAILDAMGKLRQVYPNILALEKTALMQTLAPAQLHREQLKRSEASMFADFFGQTTGHDLSDSQTEALENLINQLHTGTDSGDKP